MEAAPSTTPASECVAAPHSTGITVIVVGLGIGGLTAAIECHRKGHTVIGFEKVAELRPFGDQIGIASNAARVVSKWGDGTVDQELQSLQIVTERTQIHDTAGRQILEFDTSGFDDGEGYLVSRGDLSMVMYEHAKALGIDIRLGKRITEYWEGDDGAGIIADGEKVTADCVVCSDGVKSAARRFVADQATILPLWDRSITRAWLGTDEIEADSESSWILEGTDRVENVVTYQGKDTVLVFSTSKRGRVLNWYCIHKLGKSVACYEIAQRTGAEQPTLLSTSKEGAYGLGFNKPAVHTYKRACFNVPETRRSDELFARVTVDETLSYIADWEVKDKLAAIIRKTPADNIADYGIVASEPLDRWVSSGGGIVLIGDAAHPFLPSAGQGGSQAIEDAATVAITLELAGKRDVPLALRTMEKLRHQRTSAIQRSDVKHEKAKRQIDSENLSEDPSVLAFPRPAWIYGHDCQTYAYEEFDKAAHSVRTGCEYVPLNVGEEYAQTFDFKGSSHSTGN